MINLECIVKVLKSNKSIEIKNPLKIRDPRYYKFKVNLKKTKCKKSAKLIFHNNNI